MMTHIWGGWEKNKFHSKLCTLLNLGLTSKGFLQKIPTLAKPNELRRLGGIHTLPPPSSIGSLTLRLN